MARLLHRLGMFSARRPLVMIGVWVLLAVAVFASVATFGAQTNNDLTLPGTGSQSAKDLLEDKFPPQQNGVNPIVFDVPQGKLTDQAYKQAVSDSVEAIKKQPHVYSVTNPLSSGGQTAGLLSKDKQTAFAPVLMDVSTGDLTTELAQNVMDATAPATKAGITTAAAGSIGSTLSDEPNETSEIVGIIAAMIILSFVLGSLVAMGLPIITAVAGLGVALSVIGLVGHVVTIPSSGPTLATMIGLGVGIDYALFLITRHQEQLRAGMSMQDSIANAVATAGSAIVFAGTTVVIALLSLGVAGIPLVSALGLASAIGVVAAVFGSITLLPAFLGLLKHRIAWARLPQFLSPTPRPGHGLWYRWSGVVRRHPVVVTVASLAFLVPLIIPVFSLELGQEDIGATDPSTTERQAYDLITAGFGVGYNGPLQVATAMEPPATPSAAYTKKYDKATSLKKDLDQKQKQLPKEQKQLEKQQKQLEAEQASLQQQGDELEAAAGGAPAAGRRAEAAAGGAPAAGRRAEPAEADAAGRGRRPPGTEAEAGAGEVRAPARGRRPGRRDPSARCPAGEPQGPGGAAGAADRGSPGRPRPGTPARAAPGPRAGPRGRDREADPRPEEAGRAARGQAAKLEKQAAALQKQADALNRQKAEPARRRPASLKRQGDALQAQADDLQAQGDALQARATKLQQEARRAAGAGRCPAEAGGPAEAGAEGGPAGAAAGAEAAGPAHRHAHSRGRRRPGHRPAGGRPAVRPLGHRRRGLVDAAPDQQGR